MRLHFSDSCRRERRSKGTRLHLQIFTVAAPHVSHTGLLPLISALYDIIKIHEPCKAELLAPSYLYIISNFGDV